MTRLPPKAVPLATGRTVRRQPLLTAEVTGLQAKRPRKATPCSGSPAVRTGRVRTIPIAANAVHLISAPAVSAQLSTALVNIVAKAARANIAQPATRMQRAPIVRSTDVTGMPKPAPSARATPRRGSRTRNAMVTAAPHGAATMHRSS